jgi:hypothetical protein
MKPTAKHHEDFLSHRSIPGVAMQHNSPVNVIAGSHSGASGSIVGIEELGTDPLYLVELSTGKDLIVRQSSLRTV